MVTERRPLIRLSKRSHATLKALSKETGKTMSDLAGDAIEWYSRDRFWEEVNRTYDAMTPQQWRDYWREFREWDAISWETLEPEDWEDERRAERRAQATPRRGVANRSRSRSRT